LPFEFKGLADNIALYVGELEELADSMRDEAEENNRLLDDGTYAAAINPYKSIGVPARKEAVPHFNFAPLKNALDRLQRAADQFDDAAQGHTDVSPNINNLLFTSERLLTRDAGLDGRPWYKHHVYAPGFYTGYGVKTLPRVREAIEAKLYDEVDHQIAVTAEVLAAFAVYLEETRALIP
ncbi:MAG: folate hydrolase, partial [Proteobacteria bacterium]|nr:folate hydrolase [Pseudomonadota bacterium]